MFPNPQDPEEDPAGQVAQGAGEARQEDEEENSHETREARDHSGCAGIGNQLPVLLGLASLLVQSGKVQPPRWHREAPAEPDRRQAAAIGPVILITR